MFNRKPALLLFLALLLTACGQQAIKTTEVVPPVKEKLTPPENTCGNPVLVNVQNLEGSSVGVFEVLNDEENLWLIFSPNFSYKMHKLHLYIGPEAGIPKDGLGNYLPNEFPLRLKNEDSAVVWNYFIPLADLSECFVVAASFQLYSRKQRIPRPGSLIPAWTRGTQPKKEPHGIYYCPRSCVLENIECTSGTDPGQYRTLTQEAWRAALAGEAYPGGFSQIFPNGLRLGCNTEINFTTSKAMQRALPMNGKAGALSKSEENPNSISNALAGQACALTLTLGFDEARENFSASPVRLGRLLVASGAFDGWQVADLLAEANAVLGGCASNYSASQMGEVLRSVNLNFVDGNTDGGFLRCP